MPIYKGNQKIATLSVGRREVNQVYHGSQLVYSKNQYVNYLFLDFDEATGVLSPPSGEVPSLNIEMIEDDTSNAYGLFRGIFYNCYNLTGTPKFPNLQKVYGTYTFRETFFNCTGLTGAPQFPKLKVVGGSETFVSMFQGCSNLSGAVYFNSLISIHSKYDFQNMFKGTKITDVHFPKTLSNSSITKAILGNTGSILYDL